MSQTKDEFLEALQNEMAGEAVVEGLEGDVVDGQKVHQGTACFADGISLYYSYRGTVAKNVITDAATQLRRAYEERKLKDEPNGTSNSGSETTV